MIKEEQLILICQDCGLLMFKTADIAVKVSGLTLYFCGWMCFGRYRDNHDRLFKRKK